MAILHWKQGSLCDKIKRKKKSNITKQISRSKSNIFPKCRLVHTESICRGQIKFVSDDTVSFNKIENSAENGENACCQQFLLIHNAIQTLSDDES